MVMRPQLAILPLLIFLLSTNLVAFSAPGMGSQKKGENEPKTIEETIDALKDTEDVAKVKKWARKLVDWKVEDGAKEAQTALKAVLENQKTKPAQISGILLGLGFKGHEGGVKQIIPFLKHDNAEIRSHAAVALEDIGSAKALRDINTALKKEKITGVRKNLVRALGTCGAKSTSTQRVLVELLRDKSPIVACNAAIALGHAKLGSKAESTLMTLALHTRKRHSGTIREAAFYALIKAGSKKAQKKTEEMFEREKRGSNLHKRMLLKWESEFDPKDQANITWRKKLGSEKIARDADPVKRTAKKKKNKKKRKKGKQQTA